MLISLFRLQIIMSEETTNNTMEDFMIKSIFIFIILILLQIGNCAKLTKHVIQTATGLRK